MKKKGTYYELFSTQAKRYITPIDGMSAEDFMNTGEAAMTIEAANAHHGHGGPHGHRPEGRPPMPHGHGGYPS